FLAVADEVHAIHRLGIHSPAEIHELVRADAMGFPATPDVIAIRRALRWRPHALAPLVVTAQQTAEAHHPRRKVRRRVDEILPPIITLIIPRRFDRWIRDPERLH